MLRITLKEFEDWLYFQNSYSKADIYKVTYQKAYTYFLHKEYTQDTCLDFLRTLDKRVKDNIISPSTYNNYLKSLRLLTKAQGMALILPVKVKKTERGYIPTLDDDEVHRILKYMYSYGNYRQAVAYHLLIEHGLRFENVRYLEWEDVKDDELFIKKTKMNRSYDVQISAELRKKIEKLRVNHSNYVFASSRGLLNRPKFNLMLRRVFKKLDINKHITSHKLRHSNATLQAAHGVNLKTISENLGHSSIKTTENYVHINKKMKRDAIRKLGISHYEYTKQEFEEDILRIKRKLESSNPLIASLADIDFIKRIIMDLVSVAIHKSKFQTNLTIFPKTKNIRKLHIS